MNVRHEMGRKTKQFFETLPLSKELIETEGRKTMKENNRKKLAMKNEDEAIKREIRKLKQLLENNRILENRQVENNRNEKSNHFMVVPKLTKQHSKVSKSFESYDYSWKYNTWFGRRIQMAIETKMTSNGIPCNVKVCLKKRETEVVDDLLQPASCNLKRNIINCEDETNFGENLADFNNSEGSAMQRFLEDIGKSKITNQDENEIAMRMMYMVNRMNLLQRDRKDIRQDKNLNKAVCMGSSKTKSSESRSYTCNEKKKLEQAWEIWRNITVVTKEKEKESKAIENKIEAFLTRVQERIEAGDFVKQKKVGKTSKNYKDLKMAHKNLKGRTRVGEKDLMEKDVGKESNIKEIMGEIKTSRKETYERLLTFERRSKRERSKVLKILAGVSENVDKKPKNFPIPTFLLKMEKRREECRSRWKNIRERKKKLEEEKKNSLREKEKQMKAMENLSKRKKLQELNERKNVLEEKRKKEKMKIKLAKVHYERTLLRSYGLRPWLYLMNLRNLQQLRSLNFFREKLMRRVFTRWKILVTNLVEEKQTKITDIYHRILQKNCLQLWIKIRDERIKQYQAAIDFYDLTITEKIFTKWMKFIQEEQVYYFNKVEIADLHYIKKLKVTFLRKWKNYPEMQRLETAKEERKRFWRQKVKQILPDYRPVVLSDKF